MTNQLVSKERGVLINKIGGWNLAEMEACNLPQDVASSFTKLMEEWVGAGLVPVPYCGTQLVNGTNHLLICRETLITAEPEEGLAEVILHHERDAKPDDGWSILCIKRIL